MQEGKRTHKHSICLGISSIIGIIVLLLEIAYIVISYQEASAQSIGTQIGTSIGITLVLPHLFFIFLATIFVIVAYFTSGLGFSITAGVLYSVSGVLMLAWVLIVVPNIVLTFVGCAYCHKKKVAKQEEEEEKRYRKEHPTPAIQRESFSQRTAQQRLGHLPMQQGSYTQPMQTNPYQAAPTMQTAYNVAMPQDPYAPIAPMQTIIPTPQNPYPIPTVQGVNPYAIYQDPVQGYVQNAGFDVSQQPYVQQPYVQQPIVQPPMPQDTVSTGYFDDFGNFHSGNPTF